MEIRQYDAKDLDAVCNLIARTLPSIKPIRGKRPWDDDLLRIEETYIQSGGDFLVACVDGIVVGMAGLKRLNDSDVEIVRMRVLPEEQGRGIGGKILQTLEKRAKELGFSRIYLETLSVRVHAHRFYLKFGYTKISERPVEHYQIFGFEKLI